MWFRNWLSEVDRIITFQDLIHCKNDFHFIVLGKHRVPFLFMNVLIQFTWKSQSPSAVALSCNTKHSKWTGRARFLKGLSYSPPSGLFFGQPTFYVRFVQRDIIFTSSLYVKTILFIKLVALKDLLDWCNFWQWGLRRWSYNGQKIKPIPTCSRLMRIDKLKITQFREILWRNWAKTFEAKFCGTS